MYTENVKSTNLTPVHTTCRCCLGALDIQLQLATWAGATDRLLVTCWNKSCSMYSVTWDDGSYGELDLSIYKSKQHADYQEAK